MTMAQLFQSYQLMTEVAPQRNELPRPSLTPSGGCMPSFQELLEGYLAHLKPKASGVVYRQLATQHFMGWSAHPTFLQLEDWHRTHASTPFAVNKGLAFLKAMYTRAMQRGLYPGPNPALGVKQHKTFARERVMSAQEVGTVLSVMDLIPPKNGALLTVLLTTGCRLSEALRMAPQHINMQTGLWLQPHTKNGKPHHSYLPTQAREAMVQLPHSPEFIFDGVADGRHYSINGAEKVWWKIREALGLDDVRLHDFRRTLASHLYLATKDDYLVKRCINHVNTSVTAIYVRISHDEVAQALQAQADRFFALAPPRPERHDPPSASPDEGSPALSRRETEVFDLVAQGRRVKDIAQALSLSAGAVKTYRERLMEKLHLTTQSELIRVATRDLSKSVDCPAPPEVSSTNGPGCDTPASACVVAAREEWPG